VEGGFKQGIKPLFNDTDEQQMYIYSLLSLKMLKSYNDKLGIVRYGLFEHEKVALMTFPLSDRILCLSIMPKADMKKIRDKVIKVIRRTNVNNISNTTSNKRDKNNDEYGKMATSKKRTIKT
jgi:hypothetical protein